MATPPSPEMAQHSSFSPAKINCDGDEEHQRLPTHNLHNCDGGGHQEWSTHAGHTSTISHLFLRPSPPAQTHSFHQDGHTSHAYSSHHLVDSSFNDAGSATDEMHLDRHGTPASAIVESTAGTKNSPPPAAGRMFACPFYLHKPRQHTKCADKSFPYLSRVREHISTHTYPYQCKRCQCYFSRQFVLKRHTDTCGGRNSRGRGIGMTTLHQAIVQKCDVEDMVEVLEQWATYGAECCEHGAFES